jgi:hypothetical protein
MLGRRCGPADLCRQPVRPCAAVGDQLLDERTDLRRALVVLTCGDHGGSGERHVRDIGEHQRSVVHLTTDGGGRQDAYGAVLQNGVLHDRHTARLDQRGYDHPGLGRPPLNEVTAAHARRVDRERVLADRQPPVSGGQAQQLVAGRDDQVQLLAHAGQRNQGRVRG